MRKQENGSEMTASKPARPLGRVAARELSAEDRAAARDGVTSTTHATGPNGDDPSDPDLGA